MDEENKPVSLDAELNNFASEQVATSKHSLFKKLISAPKKYLIAGGLGLLVAVGAILFFVLKDDPVPVVVNTVPEIEVAIEEPAPVLFASPLTGAMVEESLTKRPVTGIMIENSLEARPQSGLLEAGVVYEAIAEYGITRFLAIYQEGTPDYIGPVRSARPYYVEWLAPFDASYAHVGGDIAGKAAISQLITKNLDQYFHGGSFDRIRTRPAPHNVYTDFNRLDALNASYSSAFTPWPRKDDKPVEVATAGKINLSISSNAFNPGYTYDKETNTYKRDLGGVPHVDERSGEQIAPKVVVAIKLGFSYYTAVDGPRTTYNTVGSGTAWIFQDGVVVEGKWSKASKSAPMSFTTTAGTVIELNRGQTWISAVSGATWQ